MNIAEAIKKYRQANVNTDDFRAVITMIIEEILAAEISKREQKISEEIEKFHSYMSNINKTIVQETEKALRNRDVIEYIKSLEMRGEPGEQGEQGLPGKDGRDGLDGKNGKDGVSGKDGKDGSPDTPEQIAKKINTLTEKIDQKTIKGLDANIRGLKELIRGVKKESGGGMGNVQHERFSLTSATTTVTTAYPISGAGYAIYGFYYNGQQLHRGLGYSIGANRKTITLLFTPDDGTEATITYSR